MVDSVLYLIGGATVLLGLVAALGQAAILEQLGMGYGSAFEGIVYLILAFFVQWRSMVSLGIAVTLYCVHTALPVVAVARLPNSPARRLVMRIVFLIPTRQSLAAIRTLKVRNS